MTVVFGNTGGFHPLDAEIFYRERKFLGWRCEALDGILWHPGLPRPSITRTPPRELAQSSNPFARARRTLSSSVLLYQFLIPSLNSAQNALMSATSRGDIATTISCCPNGGGSLTPR